MKIINEDNLENLVEEIIRLRNALQLISNPPHDTTFEDLKRIALEAIR